MSDFNYSQLQPQSVSGSSIQLGIVDPFNLDDDDWNDVDWNNDRFYDATDGLSVTQDDFSKIFEEEV